VTSTEKLTTPAPAPAATAVAAPAKTATTKAAVKAPSKPASKAVAKPAVKAKNKAKSAVTAAAKPAASPKKNVKVAAPKAVAKPVVKPAAKPVAVKAPKAKKPKMVRDSFTIPKPEYDVLDVLKLRAAKLGNPVKKTELIRAGMKAIAALTDTAFKAALQAVPSLKTGRPAKAKKA
jgi:hypothetical protein